MMKSVFLVVVSLSAYFPTATANTETVWLKDVTQNFQRERGILSGSDLPDQLFFQLKSNSDDLTLNLKRNHLIDPNADIYIVSKLNDGRSHVEKTSNLEKEDLAYYQDKENGAFMTARCVRRLGGQCDILIKGNIQIGDINYDLRPLEADIASTNFLENTDLFGKRYVLQVQGNIPGEMSTGKKVQTNLNKRNIEEKLTDLLARIQHNHFIHPDVMLTARNITGLRINGTLGGNSYNGTNNKDDKIRNLKKSYYVEVAVLTDSGIWDLFLELSNSSDPVNKVTEAKLRIREFYSHVINGVDLLYKGIEDDKIEVSVILRSFFIFQAEACFPHNESRVKLINGKTYIDLNKLMTDLASWDRKTGLKIPPKYDQAMLFTRHILIRNRTVGVAGSSYRGQVCTIGLRVQVVFTFDYFLTVHTAAHELGHSLGSWHDGEMDSKDCKAEDSFIMTPKYPKFNLTTRYTRNHWRFSNCSVESFKKTMRHKTCLNQKGVYSAASVDEWRKIMMQKPGERYTPNEQCQIMNGPRSTYCRSVPEMICRFMQCTDPQTGRCEDKYIIAATGTACGPNRKRIIILCCSGAKKDYVLQKFQNRSKQWCDTINQV